MGVAFFEQVGNSRDITINSAQNAAGIREIDLLIFTADLYAAQGRYAEAESGYKSSLEQKTKRYGQDHSKVARARNGLGRIRLAQGRYAEAEGLHEAALSTLEKVLGAKHRDVARCQHDLALVYHRWDRSTEAEPLMKRSLSVREDALGDEHPDVGESLNALGALY